MRFRKLSLSWFVLMCIATSARSHQVQLGVEQGLDGNSNVLSSPVLPIADGIYRFTPSVKFEQPDSPFTYRLEYRPTYSGYFETDNVNGWDQRLLGRAGYEFSSRDELRMDASFLDVLGIRQNTFTDALGQTQLLSTQLGTTRRLVANLAWDHRFSDRTTGTVGLNYNFWEYIDSPAVDNQGYAGNLQLTHAATSRWVVGANLDTSYRSFDESGFTPASYTTIVNANLLAIVRLTDQSRLEVRGGPAGVFARQSEPSPRIVSRWSPFPANPFLCPGGPCARVWGPVPAPPTTSNCQTSLGVPILETCGLSSTPVTGVPGFPDEMVAIPVDPNQNAFGRSDDRFTYFVNVTFGHKFRRGTLDLTFSRNEDSGGGIGSTTIGNSGVLALSYRLSDLWRLGVNATYLVRESVSRFPSTSVSARPSSQTFGGETLAEAGFVVANLARIDFEQRIGVAEATLERRLGEHSYVRFRFRYYNQSQQVSNSGTDVSFDRYLGGIFYVYRFAPYKL